MEREPLDAASQRVFFALWPDESVRRALGATARRMHRVMHGRRTRDESIHLTLAFIGEVGIEAFARLQSLPEALLCERFLLTLDRWDCWPRNGIGWAGPSRIPDALGRLAEGLEDWLRGAGFEPERRPFLPHVTLIRRAQYAAMPEPMAPIAWPVDELALVRSQLLPRGSRYEVAARWALR